MEQDSLNIEPVVYDVKTTAAVLGVTPNFIYELCRTNRLRHLKLGRRVLIPRDAVTKLLETETNSTPN